MVDPFTLIEQAVIARLKAEVAEVEERVYGLLRHPLEKKDVPALVVTVDGDLPPVYDEGQNPGERYVIRTVQFHVDIVANATAQTFADTVRRLYPKVVSALAPVFEYLPDMRSIWAAGAQHEDYEVQAGLGGGIAAVFKVTFQSPEFDFSQVVPRIPRG